MFRDASETAAAAANRLSNAWEALMASLARSGPLQLAARGMQGLADSLNNLSRPVGTVADASRAAIDRTMVGIDARIKTLGQSTAELKKSIELATQFPELAANLSKRQATLKQEEAAIATLQAQYDAVLIAIGCKSGRPLPVPGADAPNVISGVAFLEAFNQGRLKAVAGRVVVIGGGDTSVDVVSVARRLGYVEDAAETERPEHVVMGHTAHDVSTLAARQGADVMLTSMQPIEQMNAAKHEIEDAQREGVKIQGNLLPKKVIVDEKSGRAKALRLIEVPWDKNKFAEKPGTEMDVEADLIVVAIGQQGDLAGMEELDNGKGQIAADKYYQLPNRQGVFACGDIIRPHLLTTVIGQGSIAADSIDRYLKGEEFAKRPKVDVHHFNLLEKLREAKLEPAKYEPSEANGPRPIDQGLRGTSLAGKAVGGFAIHNYEDRSAAEVSKPEELFLGHFAYAERIKRTEIGPSAEEVLGHFAERMVGLDDKQAVEEAKRCMSCGMCFECDNCVIYCPQTAVKRTPKAEATMGRYVYTDYDLCIGCHICADVCPTGYIKMGMGDH